MNKNDITLLELLNIILEQLKVNHCNYAIIHNSESLEEAIKGDIDLAFDTNPIKMVYPVLQTLQNKYCFKLVQCLHYDIPHGYYFIIEFNSEYLHLDCLYDPNGISRYHLSTQYLLNNLDTTTEFNSVNSNAEYIYSLIKRSLKGSPTALHVKKLCANYPDDEETQNIITHWIGRENHTQLKQLNPDNIEDAQSLLETCGRYIQNTYKKNNCIQYYYGLAYSALRKFKRLIQPTGIFVVIVGPDGCGKSTINTETTAALTRAFRKTWSFHWRPCFLPKLGKASTNSNFSDNTPSQKSKYKGPISYIRFIYYWLDFLLGYWVVVYPKKAQSTFIIGERYYLDILVHPERYGFSCPQWFIKLFGFFIPKPDLTILLSADPQQIHDRKPELPVNIIDEQIHKYTSAIKNWGESSIIDTSQSITDSKNELVNKVLNKCATKLKEKLK